jgi:hypothetical protein
LPGLSMASLLARYSAKHNRYPCINSILNFTKQLVLKAVKTPYNTCVGICKEDWTTAVGIRTFQCLLIWLADLCKRNSTRMPQEMCALGTGLSQWWQYISPT